jgi:hypothetical protein
MSNTRIPTGYNPYGTQPVIFQSANSVVTRCLRESDKRPVIVKVNTNEFAANAEIALIQKDYDITKLLTNNILDGSILESLDICRVQKSMCIVKEDFEAVDFSQYVSTLPNNVMLAEELLPLALKIANTYAQMVHNFKF